MRTLTILAACLTVALGIPLEKKEAQVVPAEALQRPLVGDLLPVQGHVVEERAAPQPQLGKEPQLSAPSPDKEEQTVIQVQELPVDKVVEESSERQDLAQEKNDIEQEDAVAPFEEFSMDSQLNEPDMEKLQAEQEQEPEIINDFVEGAGQEERIQEIEDSNHIEDFEQPGMKMQALTDEEEMQIHMQEDHNDIAAKYDFEQPIMKLEPLPDEEEMPIQGDVNDIEAKYDFEQPIMKLEPLPDEDIQRDELLQFSEARGVYEEPSMYLEPEEAESQFMNAKIVPEAVMSMEDEGPMPDALGEPLQRSEEDSPYDEGFLMLETLDPRNA